MHSAKHVFGSKRPGAKLAAQQPDTRRINHPEAADTLSDPLHPVVIRHPLSGKKALYINPQFTLRFEGWSDAESRVLINYLASLATDPADVYEFEWRAGSVALWDNRATWHNARNDYHGHRRAMHRITIEGCALTAA